MLIIDRSSRRRRHLLSVTTAAAAVFASHAQADVLIDNLSEPTRGTTICDSSGPEMRWAAQSFTTPVAVRFVSIETPMGLAVGAPDIVAQLRVGPSPDLIPGSLAANLAVPALSETTVETVTLTPDRDVVFEPGQTYWIILGPATQGSFGWDYADSNT
jgi:hypothetical protein